MASPLNNDVDILAVGAHPGDVEFMCGAALAALAQRGRQCLILHLTSGEAGHPSLGRKAYARQKEEEAREMAAILGAGVMLMGIPDGYVENSLPYREELARLIREVRPRVIVTHWKGSFHRDHRAAHELVRDAAFLAAIPGDDGGERGEGHRGDEWHQEEERHRGEGWHEGNQTALPPHGVSRILYGENWEDHEGFVPQVYIDVTAGFATWQQALQRSALARGEVATFRYRQYYEALAALRGAEVGCDSAQAFARPSYGARVALEDFPMPLPRPAEPAPAPPQPPDRSCRA